MPWLISHNYGNLEAWPKKGERIGASLGQRRMQSAVGPRTSLAKLLEICTDEAEKTWLPDLCPQKKQKQTKLKLQGGGTA